MTRRSVGGERMSIAQGAQGAAAADDGRTPAKTSTGSQVLQTNKFGNDGQNSSNQL